jgi:hypothetical protein
MSMKSSKLLIKLRKKNIEFAITHAENATSNVINQTLEKIR